MPVQKQRLCVRADGRAPEIDERFIRHGRLAIQADGLIAAAGRRETDPADAVFASP